jgi:putative tricarboxylic transport membrane protein
VNSSRRSDRVAYFPLWLALCAAVAQAQAPAPAWRPGKPIEIISPSAPGGSTDAMARTIQKVMQQAERNPVPLNVINKAGGNQTVAMAYLNQHAGDAHYVTVATRH